MAAFKEGLFEVQDASSQCVAPFLQVEPGMKVIDACAGGGGKTLHIGALMQNKGRILALDVHQWKLNELRKRCGRAGVDVAETRMIEGSKSIKRLAGYADRVLLDVPCSGLGVLRRNPDAKWKLSNEEIDRLIIEQQDILTRYSVMVKPGGKLVYATCSVLPSENEDQVQKFLAKHGDDWTLEEEMKINPAESGHDGFYGARLVRKAAVVPETAVSQSEASESADETPTNNPETATE
jgi:16S rRNA (cytosine967-C5)-methyltransferase